MYRSIILQLNNYDCTTDFRKIIKYIFYLYMARDCNMNLKTFPTNLFFFNNETTYTILFYGTFEKENQQKKFWDTF